MKPADQSEFVSRDCDVDALLEYFFRHELPAEMPALPLPEVPARSSPNRRWRRGNARLAAAVAAMAAAVLWTHWTGRLAPVAKSTTTPPNAHPGPENFVERTGPANADHLRVSVDTVTESTRADQGRVLSDTSDLEYWIVSGQRPLERVTYDTTHGRFEQRAQINWMTFTVMAPQSGEYVRWTIPQLDIEVVPVGYGDSNQR
jgi:hypothetical protein